jgi:serine acetyltransferase
VNAPLAGLMKEDFERYTRLHYLEGASRLRQRVAAARHRGLRTIWYFRLRHAASALHPALKFPGILLCAALKLVLRPSRSCEIPLGAEIGGGCFLPHPIGIVVAAHCHIGAGVSIFSGVVLGINHMSANRGAPVLGNHVTLYAGAKVIGHVTVGDHAVVGANAVVNTDVVPCTVVAGVPARQVAVLEPGKEIPF